ncbi:MAG TPA: dihydroorotate dehydrogenase-like protein [Prolixibacteraceae bacterium]|nr:dihydroorotate dehydrogenase-like protein [Prolixibacteraceae bacterium]
MPNLSTTYMGLALKNPLVVSSSGLTNSIEKILQLEAKGVGAIVLKSLFEEQITNEVIDVINQDVKQVSYPEAEDYIWDYIRETNLQTYLDLIRIAKSSLKIPVIASVNCVTGDEWIAFARDLEKAGADALEINAFIMPTDRKISSADIEFRYLDILTEVRRVVKIPVAMKISNNFTNLVGMVDKLSANGAEAIVMFNRFFEPDIDLETLTMTTSSIYSSPDDLRHSLRWTGIVSGKVPNLNIAASTGIHDGEAFVKQILAGATVGQICSTLYLNGFGQIDEILDYLKSFMVKWNFKQISDFRGRLNYSKLSNPTMYERAQFMKYFSGAK